MPETEMNKSGENSGTLRLMLIIAFLVFSAGTILTEQIYYENVERRYKNNLEDELKTIAALKVKEISEWRSERMGNAYLIFDNKAFCGLVENFLMADGDVGEKQELLEWLERYYSHYRYDQIRLMDATGFTVTSFPLNLAEPAEEVVGAVKAAKEILEPFFIDFYHHPADYQPHISILVPITGSDNRNVIAEVSMRTDPYEYLYPAIQTWPTPSKTGEMLLVRKDGNDVLFLNELKFAENAPLTLRVPLADTEVLSVKAILGRSGYFEGKDYRNENCVSYSLPVPDSPWFLIAKIDRDEAYAELYEQKWQFVVMAVLLILFTAATLSMIWRQQRAIELKTLVKNEREKEWLRNIIEQSANEIYVFDAGTTRFVFVNAGMVNNIGYSIKELYSMTPVDIKPDCNAATFNNLIEPLISGERRTIVFETEQRRKNGTRYPVEIRYQIARMQERNVILAIVIDITDRQKMEKALVASEHFLRSIYEGAGIPITVFDIVNGDFVLTDCNAEYEQIMRLDKDRIKGRKLKDLYRLVAAPEASSIDAYRYFNNALERGCTCQYEEHTSIHGTETWWLTSITPLENGSGKFDRIIVTTQNITDRKAAEFAIVESETQLVTVFDSIPDGIFVHPPDGAFITANKSACERLGYSKEELLALRPQDIVSDRFKDGVEARIGRIETSGEYTFDSEHVSKNGTIVPVEITSSLIEFKGKPVVLSVARDVRERRKAEAALKASEARYRSLFEHMNEAFAYHQLILDESGKPVDYVFLAVNAEFEKQTGLKDVIGKKVSEVIPGINEQYPDLIEAYTRVALTGDPESLELDFSPLKRTYTISVYSPQKGFFVTIFNDVTAQRSAELEKKKLEHQLQQTQKLESLGVLAGGIAHDFNNILTAVIGHAELALEKVEPSTSVWKNIQLIISAAKRASTLANQMLTYSGKAIYKLSYLNLSVIVREMTGFLRSSLSKKADLILDLDDNVQEIKADEAQIQQVIMNLIINASESFKDGAGRITVKTSSVDCDPSRDKDKHFLGECNSGKYVCLEVADTGSGMDENTLGRIFEPFFSTKFTGRGLGLSAVLGIVRTHNGGLSVSSKPGEGTVFRVYFPACDEKPKAAERPAAENSGTKGKRFSGTVLVADDEEQILKLARKLLERAGFKTLTASDGIEALELAAGKDGEIDLVILDLTMPRMDGIEVLKEIRKTRPEIKVIISSGYSESDVAQMLGSLSISAILHKPFTQSSLLNAILEANP